MAQSETIGTSNFPSDLWDPKKKQGKDYSLKYGKAFLHEHEKGLTSSSFGFRGKSFEGDDMTRYRMYAKGEQPTDKYKTIYSHQRNVGKGKRNLSHTAIDYSILAVAPRIVQNLVGKLLGQDMTVNISAVDPISVSEKNKTKHKIVTYLHNKGFLEKIAEKANFDVQDLSPIPEGVPEPSDQLNLDDYTDLFFKNKWLMEMKDFITHNYEVNDADKLLEELATDLVEVGAGGIRVWMDRQGNVKFRRCVVEETVANNCRFEDFRDLTRVGEFIYVTIAELRSLWPGQPEQTYLDIANGATSKYSSSANHYTSRYHESGSFPYDDERVRIFDYTWKSSDQVSKVIKEDTKTGHQDVFNKPYNWAAKINREEYKERFPNREIIERVDENWYQAKLIVGTNHIFDYGLATNIIREGSNMSRTRPNFILQRTPPIMKHIIPVLDQIQLNFLKWQQHVMTSMPRQMSIEMTALENISLTKGGKKMTPKEALALYFETGIILWRRTNWRGSEAQFKPIEHHPGNISQLADQHYGFIISGIDLLRYLVGLPEVTDSTVPNPEIGKGVMMEAISSVADTMRRLYNSWKFSYKALARNVLDLTVDSVIYFGGDQYVNALGIDSVVFTQLVQELSSRELGIIIEIGPDSEKRVFLQQMIIKAQENQQIDAETAYILQHEKNYLRVVLILKQKAVEAQKAQSQAVQEQTKAELDKNAASTNIANEGEINKLIKENELAIKLADHKHQLKVIEDDNIAKNDIILKKLEHDQELDENEQKFVNDATLADKKEASTAMAEA